MAVEIPRIHYIQIALIAITVARLIECKRGANVGEATRNVEMFTFAGAPVDDVASADTPAHYIVVRSNLKGSIKIVVNKRMSIEDMKVNVKMAGILGSNFSDYQVKYRRKPGDSGTVFLEVHESSPNDGNQKLSKTTLAVMSGTALVCMAATASAILGCIVSLIVRQCKARRKHLYESCSDSATESEIQTDSSPDSSTDSSTNSAEMADDTDESNSNESSEEESVGDDYVESEHGLAGKDVRHLQDYQGKKRGMTVDPSKKREIIVDQSIMPGMAADQSTMRGMTVDQSTMRGMTVDQSKKRGMTADHFKKSELKGLHNKKSITNLDTRELVGGHSSTAVSRKCVDSSLIKKNGKDAIVAKSQSEKQEGTVVHKTIPKNFMNEKGRHSKIELQHSYHGDEDFLSVHRHGEYNSFVHEDVDKTDTNESHVGSAVNNMDVKRRKGDKACDLTLQMQKTGPNATKKPEQSAKKSNQKKKTEKLNARIENRAPKEKPSYHEDEDFLSVHRHGEYSSFVHDTAASTVSSHSNTENDDVDVIARKDNKKETVNSPSKDEKSLGKVAKKKAGKDNKAKSIVNLNSNIHETLTANGSHVGLNTEQLKSAHLIRKANTSSSSGSDGEVKKDSAVKVSKCGKGVERVIEEAIDAQSSQSKTEESKKVKKGARTFPNTASTYGGGASFSGHHTLFIACIIGCLSISLASLPDLTMLQSVTADITIEIPDLIERADVFVNRRHRNDVKVTGDQQYFKWKVFDVDSVSKLESDNCRGMKNGDCDTGTCDLQTGACVCQRDFLYQKLFLKCVPDCSRSCPFEFFMAKPCSILSPGECRRCRSPCEKPQFESTACGGANDRVCSDISKLPPVTLGESLVAEDMKKVKQVYQRLQPTEGQTTVTVLDRGTGVKVKVHVLEASFDIKVAEERDQNYDVDTSDSFALCKYAVPIYFIARRQVLNDKFYYGLQKNTHCKEKIPKFEGDGAYCLGGDSELVRLFTKNYYYHYKDAFVHSEASKLCGKLLHDCFQCTNNCSKASMASSCAHNRTGCYNLCNSVECSCSKSGCPCSSYYDKCAGKAVDCVGVNINRITLEPVFSQDFSYCRVKILRLATYKIRTDIIVNGEVLGSRYHDVNANSKNKRHVATEDDYGYMFVKVPDPLKLNGKNMLLRRVKNTKIMEVGYFKMADRSYSGSQTNSLAFWPRTPYSLSKNHWNNMTCSKIRSDTFSVFDGYPIRSGEPNIFEKLNGYSFREEYRSGAESKIFSVWKTDSSRFIDLLIPTQRSVLRHVFPKSDVIQDELYARLLNKSSYWSASVQGSLKSCPGSFTVKLFEGDRSENLLYHSDIAVTKSINCHFKFEFNMPFKNGGKQSQKVFLLHLITRKQTIKLVLLREKKTSRILQTIHIPPVDKGQLLNAVLPITVIAGGLIYMLILLLVFGAITKPKGQLYQVEVDNEFHFRHALVVALFVCARLAKSLLLTITFLTYVFVVIHSKNYHTLKGFKNFQLREKAVIKSIFEDMEKHRVAEVNRQEKRFVDEKNICEMNLRKLDAYLSERKRDSSWEQQINKRAKSIKKSVMEQAMKGFKHFSKTFNFGKMLSIRAIEYEFGRIRSMVNQVRGKVVGHPYLQPARILFKLYRAFGGNNNWAQYVGLDVNFNHLNYHNEFERGREFFDANQALKRTQENQENSENTNHKIWLEQSKARIYQKPPIAFRIRSPKIHTGLGFDKNVIKDVFAVTWIVEMVKKQIFSHIGTIIMITLDALFFVYRHTRTYAMAAAMVQGFKKTCDLDEMQESWERNEEKKDLVRKGFKFARSRSIDQTPTNSTEEFSSDERVLVGDGLSTSTDEYEARGALHRSEGKEDTSSGSTSPVPSNDSTNVSLGTPVTCQNTSNPSDIAADAKDGPASSESSSSLNALQSLGASRRVTGGYKGDGLAAELYYVIMTIIGWLGVLLQTFVTFMKKINIINMLLLNTHVILIFFIMSLITVCVYFTILTAKFVIRTPVLDDLGFFDVKISPIVTYRKVVNTRTSVNAFMINHVHVPYYEARMNARIEVYRLKAELYKKIQCTRAVLHNTEYCSWKQGTCHGLGAHDDNFYKNLTQFKCHISPVAPKRYTNFDRVQFKNEMMRSYGPYIDAFRGIILDTFQLIITIICIQVALKISSNIVLNLLLKFDLVRQIKVYRTRRPLETWDFEKEQL